MEADPGGHTLASGLESLYRQFERSGRVPDPIDTVRGYAEPADREIAGFIAAGLAFGRVASILTSIGAVLGAMGASPSAFVRAFDARRDAGPFRTFVHRWTRGPDIVALIFILQHMLESSGSLEQFFLDGDDPDAPDIGPGLESFCGRARDVDLRRA